MPGLLLETPEAVDQSDLPGSAHLLPSRDRIVMARPDHFEVTRHDNPHTVDDQGRLNEVDPEEARRQWETLRTALDQQGYNVDVLPARRGLPDLVFCCNTAWPFLDEDGQRRYIPARMRYEGRRGEVPVMEDHLRSLGYEPVRLSEDAGVFEAGGDVQWLGARRALLGAVGPRTDRSALELVAKTLGTPLVQLDLADEAFYHLDTCLAVLSSEHIAYVPAAFDPSSREKLDALGAALIELPEEEARTTFAANLQCPDGETVFIDEANHRTMQILEKRGYDVVGVDTSEFRKAGGSVFCMTNQLW